MPGTCLKTVTYLNYPHRAEIGSILLYRGGNSPIDSMLKCYLQIDPKIDWPKFIIDHIWRFYDSISLCWTIFRSFGHFSVVILSSVC